MVAIKLGETQPGKLHEDVTLTTASGLNGGQTVCDLQPASERYNREVLRSSRPLRTTRPKKTQDTYTHTQTILYRTKQRVPSTSIHIILQYAPYISYVP